MHMKQLQPRPASCLTSQGPQHPLLFTSLVLNFRVDPFPIFLPFQAMYCFHCFELGLLLLFPAFQNL